MFGIGGVLAEGNPFDWLYALHNYGIIILLGGVLSLPVIKKAHEAAVAKFGYNTAVKTVETVLLAGGAAFVGRLSRRLDLQPLHLLELLRRQDDEKRQEAQNFTRRQPFCSALSGVMTAVDIFTPVKAFSEMENRDLRTESRLSISRLISGDFQKDYETMVSDQFAGRDGWITAKSVSESALQKTENNGVLYGKNGAFFRQIHLV